MKREKQDVFKTKDSEKLGEFAGLLSAVMNVSFALTKGVFSFFADSVALRVDALNNFFDAVSGALAFLAFHFAARFKSGERGRLVALGTYSIALWMVASGLFGFADALGALFEKAEALLLPTGLLVLFAVCKLLLFFVLFALFFRTRRAALLLCAKDSLLDFCSGVLLVLSVHVPRLFACSTDALIGALFSVLLVRLGFSGARSAFVTLFFQEGTLNQDDEN